MGKGLNTEYDNSVVKVTGGPFKGRIGYVDCASKSKHYVVHFGEMLVARDYEEIPTRYLIPVTTPDLLDRREQIGREIALGTPKRSAKEKISLLLERNLIAEVLYARLLEARLSNTSAGKRIFLSHSSKDKQFVKYLAVDLGNAGHSPWLDEWEIRVGESIPTRVGEGLDQADAVVVVLSQNASASRWVEREWQAKYWRELSENKIMVLPILYEDCSIPTLLSTKRYADFREEYRLGFSQLLEALK